MFEVKEVNKKTSELLRECKKLFPIWTYKDIDEFDKNFPIPKELTTRYFQENIEADEKYKNMSWNDLNEKYDINEFMTFRERIILGLDYFKKTGKHLDNENWTLTSSRDSDGDVPGMGFSPHGGKVYFYYWNADYSDGDLRARRAVSSPSKLSTFPLEFLKEFNHISPQNLDDLLEYLQDKEMLSEKGLELRQEFWKLFIKE